MGYVWYVVLELVVVGRVSLVPVVGWMSRRVGIGGLHRSGGSEGIESVFVASPVLWEVVAGGTRFGAGNSVAAGSGRELSSLGGGVAEAGVERFGEVRPVVSSPEHRDELVVVGLVVVADSLNVLLAGHDLQRVEEGIVGWVEVWVSGGDGSYDGIVGEGGAWRRPLDDVVLVGLKRVVVGGWLRLLNRVTGGLLLRGVADGLGWRRWRRVDGVGRYVLCVLQEEWLPRHRSGLAVLGGSGRGVERLLRRWRRMSVAGTGRSSEISIASGILDGGSDGGWRSELSECDLSRCSMARRDLFPQDGDLVPTGRASFMPLHRHCHCKFNQTVTTFLSETDRCAMRHVLSWPFIHPTPTLVQ